MIVEQTIARAGNHLVVTLSQDGRVIKRKVWENCAQYIESETDGVLVIKVPIKAQLNVKPKVWEGA